MERLSTYSRIMLGMLLIFSQYASGANYYFSSKSGDDARTVAQAQNPETPWKSIEKLNAIFQTLQPGDAIYFKSGEIFFGTIHINKSGTASNPIKIGAYGPGAKPVITSLVTLDKWKSTGSGKVESQNALNTSEVKVLVIDGELQELGRFPNSDTANEGYLTIDGVSGTNSITGNKLPGNPNWKGAEVVIKKNQWVIDATKIISHSGNSLGFNNVGSYEPKKGYGFFIQNHIQTLDKHGEWFFNPSNKKMNLFLGNQNPSSLKIQASTLDHLLTKTYGASHIHLENLHFNGSNKDVINIAGGSNIKFAGITVENSGENGILSLSVIDLMIEKSHIKNSKNNGLYLRYGNTGAVVKDNVVENSGLFPGGLQNGDGNGIGIYAVTDNIVVENNKVLNSGYSGIHFGGNNTVVKNNFVNNFCLIKADGGGIYTYGGPKNPTFKNRKVINNIVLNAKGSWGGVPQEGINFRPLADGIFLDDNSNGVEVVGNTVAHATNSGIKMSNVTRVVVKNNTFFDATQLVALGNNELGGDVRDVAIQNNILFSKHPNQYAYRIHTNENDIKEMGIFDANYFFRPLGDDYSINFKYEAGTGAVERNVNLKQWNSVYQKDLSSKSHQAKVEKFKVNKRIGANLITNGDFRANTKGFGFNDATSSWVADKINGGTLQVTSKKKSSVTVNVGSLKKDKKYLLQFKSRSNKPGVIRVFLRESFSPWQTVSTSTTFEITDTETEFRTVVSPYQDVDNTVLLLATEDPGFTYWIDDLEFVEVDVEVADPNRKILFEYNPSHTAKTIKLDGTYVDAKNKEYKQSVTIPPFGSVVLVNTSNASKGETPSVEEKPKELAPRETAKEASPLKTEAPKKVPVTETTASTLTQYFNTTGSNEITYKNKKFVNIPSEQLLTDGSNVSTNTAASSEKLFQKGRFSKSLSYAIPLANGTYTVETYHVEPYYGQSGRDEKAGQRVFDISLEGKVVKKNFDLFVENKNNETVLTFNNVTVKDGVLNLDLNASVNSAIISGIGIIGKKPENAATEKTSASFHYFNTTGNKEITYKNKKFVNIPGEQLLTEGTNISSNPAASKEPLFQKGRFAKSLSYAIPVPNGAYTVETYHIETYYGHSGRGEKAGQRVFDILLEGKVVKKDFDIYLENKNKETVLTFKNVTVNDGVLNLELNASVNSAIISGMGILRTD